MRRSIAAGVALVAVLASASLVAAATAPPPRHDDDIAAELEITRRTEAQVRDRLRERETTLAGRVRALYKLTRGGLEPLVASAGARADLTRRRALARRLIVRDLQERGDLRDELARATRERNRLEREVAHHDVQAAMAEVTLAPPVAHGAQAVRATDAATGAHLVSRGTHYPASEGEVVHAPSAGVVRYAGPIHGLGNGIVLALGNEVTVVVGGLGQVDVQRGTRIEAGAPLGRAGSAGIAMQLYVDGRDTPISAARH